MAIGRISGPMLYSNLERQAANLTIDTDLVIFDVTNRRLGVNNTTPGYSIDTPGNVRLANITILGNTITSNTGKINLGAADNVVITGGAANYVLTTDGAGNTSWANVSALQATVGVDGTTIILGTPTDGSLTANAAYDGWTANTTVTNAIDNLNQVALNIGQNTFVGNVQFTANVVAGASPQTIRFTGTASGNPNAYYWDFGDGNTSSAGSSVTKTYSNVSGGTFTVYYRAYNTTGTWSGNASLGAIGSVDDFTRTNYITLYTPNPIASFTANLSSMNSGNVLSITDTSQYDTNYSVYWGDGTVTISPTAGGSQKHTYTNTGGDATYSIILQANSTTAGPSNVSVNSASTTTKVYSTHTPTFSNTTNRVINWEANGGGTVTYTNTTSTAPGSAAAYGAQQVYQYYWGDGTANSNVAIGSAASGDTSQSISHIYALSAAQQIAGTTVTYGTMMKLYNGHTTSPFNTTNVTVIVEPSVRSNVQARANIVSDGSSDTALTGYIFTDYNGYDRSLFTFRTAPQFATTYNWTWGDASTTGNISDGAAGTLSGGNITHAYASTGTKSAALTVYGNPGTIAQSNVKSVNITISSNPAAPGNLSTKTITMSSASQGTGPLLAAGARDNTAGNIAANASSVTRYTTTTPILTSTVTQANSSLSGTLTAVVNGTGDGNTSFGVGTNATGTYTSLVVASDADAHSAIAATYPTGFYKVFSAYASKALTGINLGYNDFTLNHSSAGKTNNVGFVKDDVTSVPTLVTTGVTMGNVAATTIRYISGVPYYQAGGNIVIQGLQAYNWIGQTYTSSTPFSLAANATLAESTSGTIASTQTKTHAQLDGATSYLFSGTPKANTGNTISNSYTFGNIYMLVDGTAAAVGNVNATLTSVNGASTAVSLPALINVYSSAYSGFDETSIGCLAGTANSTVAKRVSLYSSNIITPVYANTVTNYYTANAWTGSQTIAGTTDAVVRWGNLKVNTTDYSTYLPPGPNLAVGGNRTTTQSFKIAFQRPIMQNFKFIFTGRIAGLYVAAPGTKLTDTASTLNGWLNANVAYAGAGYPGDNTGAGGNGGPGCAVGTTVPTSTFVSNVTYTLTLGSADLSNSAIHQCLLNLVLGPNDFVSNVWIGAV